MGRSEGGTETRAAEEVVTRSVLVTFMGGSLIEPVEGEPDPAELDAIKRRYLAMGADVVSVRTVDAVRIPPYRNDREPLPEDVWR